MTKPCPCPSLGHDSLLYSFSPCISQHSQTSKQYLWSSQPFPAIYFRHHSKMRQKMKGVRWKSRRQSSVPKQRWDTGKARPQPLVRAWAENTTCSQQEATLLQAVFKGVGEGCTKQSSASWCCPALTQGAHLQEEQSATKPSQPQRQS